jgi:hypothetical protein
MISKFVKEVLIIDSYTAHYRICRDWPTNVLSCMLLYLHDGSHMFRQGNAIIKEWLGSFWVTSKLIWYEASHGTYCRNLCTGVLCSELWWYTTKRILASMHLVVYHHSSLHNTPVHRFLPYVPWLASYHIDVDVTQKEPSHSLMMALPCRNM